MPHRVTAQMDRLNRRAHLAETHRNVGRFP